MDQLKRSRPWWRRISAVPGYLFLLAVPAWRYLRQAVGLLSDADFLLGKAQESGFNVKELLSDWGWVPALALGFAWLYATRETEKREQAIKQGKDYSFVTPGRFLAFCSMIFVVGTAFVTGRAIPYESWFIKHSHPFAGWAVAENGFNFWVDGMELRRFDKNYLFAVSCRPQDKTIDFVSDPKKVTSRTFPISDVREIAIYVPSDKMAVFGKYSMAECKGLLVTKADPKLVSVMGRTVGIHVPMLPAVNE